MAVKQVLSQRYIDKEKLGKFWRTHPDFKGQACILEAKDDSYLITIPRKMTEDEIKSVHYDEDTLAHMEAEASTV